MRKGGGEGLLKGLFKSSTPVFSNLFGVFLFTFLLGQLSVLGSNPMANVPSIHVSVLMVFILLALVGKILFSGVHVLAQVFSPKAVVPFRYAYYLSIIILFTYINVHYFLLWSQKSIPSETMRDLLAAGIFVLATVKTVKIFRGLHEVFLKIRHSFLKLELVIVAVALLFFFFPLLVKSFEARPAAEASKNHPYIFLLTFDALSAEHMSAFGYSRKTTPFMESLGNGTYYFSNSHSSSNTTITSLPNILRGKPVYEFDMQNLGLFGAPNPEETWAHYLKNNGYSTAFLSCYPPIYHVMNKFADAFSYFNDFLYNGFLHNLVGHSNIGLDGISLFEFIYIEELFNKTLKRFGFNPLPGVGVDKTRDGVTVYDPEIIYRKIKKILHSRPGPLAVWAHFGVPHYPFVPPEPYRGRFYKGSVSYSQAREEKNYEVLKKLYDETILYTDQTFKEFVAFLKAEGIYQNSIFILSADHGDEFLGIQDRWLNLSEGRLHIPLIVHIPKREGGGQSPRPIGHANIAPTIVELANLPKPAWLKTQSAMEIFSGPPPEKAFEISATFLGPRQYSGNHIIVCYHSGYKLLYSHETKTLKLFDLKADPQEKENVLNRNLKVAATMFNHIVSKYPWADPSVLPT